MSFGGKNSMSLIKCNKCGEVYSDSYKKCPFCVEDEEYYNGKVKKRGHRQMEKRKKAPSVVGPVLVLAVLVLAGILVWAFAGDTVRGWFGGDKQPEDVDPGTTQNQPVNTPVDNEPVVKALALDHMSLLMAPGESEKLTATGGAEESYQWITSDSGVLKVSDDGTVSALTEGSAVVTVTCGEESVACAVTVKEKADTNTTPNTNTNNNNTNNNNSNTNNNNTTNKPDTNTSSSLKNLKIKTEYGIDLAAREDGVYDITMQSSEKTCQLTLEGITGTPTWKSSNTNVVKVSSDGKLERVGKGEATVTITLGSATAEILVRVN